jgi:serine phosphatase RsbU (regulator of sigma subunit)
VPLCDYAGRLVGVLQVLNRRSGPFGEYEQSLAEALAAQAGVALQRAKLLEHFLEKQQMERAMAIARDIQQGLLPRELPELPGYEVSGLSLPADQTGGDTYDLLGAEGQRLMMTVADATGHGIGPALVISTTRAMLRAVSLGERNVAAILRTVNDLLCEDLTDGRFVTCFLAELESRTHRLRFASAGHGPILLYRRGEDRFDEPPAAGPPLGVLGGIDFGEEGCCTLERGDFLAVTTDGVFEATDPTGEMFGVDRLKDKLREMRDRSAAEMIDALRRALGDHAHGLRQGDDVTAVVLKRID